jgi:hypothetical protein
MSTQAVSELRLRMIEDMNARCPASGLYRKVIGNLGALTAFAIFFAAIILFILREAKSCKLCFRFHCLQAGFSTAQPSPVSINGRFPPARSTKCMLVFAYERKRRKRMAQMIESGSGSAQIRSKQIERSSRAQIAVISTLGA